MHLRLAMELYSRRRRAVGPQRRQALVVDLISRGRHVGASTDSSTESSCPTSSIGLTSANESTATLLNCASGDGSDAGQQGRIDTVVGESR